LVIGVLNAIVGTYGSFSMYNSLISSIYKIEGGSVSEAAQAENENGDHWNGEISSILTSRLDYANNFCANFFGVFCCSCCTNRWDCSRQCALRRARHEESVKRLSKELDLLDFIKFMRQT
jgi:hypothetical protein